MDYLGVNILIFLRILTSFLTTNLAKRHTYLSCLRITIIWALLYQFTLFLRFL